MEKSKCIDIATYVPTEESKKRALASERGYRRGYHHGFVQAKLKNNKVTEEDIEYWRYRYPIEKGMWGPEAKIEEIRRLRKKKSS